MSEFKKAHIWPCGDGDCPQDNCKRAFPIGIEQKKINALLDENMSLRARLAEVEAERDAALSRKQYWWDDVCAATKRAEQAEAREKAKDERIRELEGALDRLEEEGREWDRLVQEHGQYKESVEEFLAWHKADGPIYTRLDEIIAKAEKALPSPSQPVRTTVICGMGKYAIVEPVKVAEGEACECGHHENDHEGSFDMKRAYCGGGLSESCSCRSWRPVTPSKESHNG